jgi:amino acid adenylation domain-containing protein/non-ribosomal peptide synthase protein (TIGR01720 family)
MIDQTIEKFQLSPQQKRAWLVQQGDRRETYCAQGVIQITGVLDPAALHAALNLVLERHEILRTVFCHVPGMAIPLQAILPSATLELPQHDLGGLSAEQQTAALEALLAEARQQAAAGEAELALRVALARLDPITSLLLVTLPALCIDAFGMQNLVQEISRFYQAGTLPEELDAPMQYVDFSEWQNELLESEETEAGRAFWREQDLSHVGLMHLPYERSAADAALFTPRSLAALIEPELAAGLETITRWYGVSVQAVLLAAWQTLLWRLTGQPKLLVGVGYDGRKYDELIDAIGLFARYLPLSSQIDEQQSFVQHMRDTHQVIQTAHKWQEYLVWDGLTVARQGAAPLFWPFCFDSEPDPVEYRAGATVFSLRQTEICFDRYNLKLTCAQHDDLSIVLSYNAEIFSEDDAQRLLDQYRTLLASVVAQPDTTVSELGLVSAAERERLLREFNSAEAASVRVRCIHETIAAWAERTPRAAAVVYEDQVLSYGELDARSNQLAQYLRANGVGPDVPVGLALDRSADLIVGLLGVLKAGGAYVPLDPTQPLERLTGMMADLSSPLLITQQSLAERLTDSAFQLCVLDRDAGMLDSYPVTPPSSSVTGANLAYILFTSGSTGQPKGVAVEHRQLAAYVQAILGRMELPSGAQFATVSTFAADLGNTVIFPALMTGSCLHIIAQERVTNPEAFADYARRQPIDCLKIVPSHLGALLSAADPAAVLPRRLLVLGGEAASWELIARVRELAPECRVLNHYGPTETTVGVLTYPVPATPSYQTATVPLGQPLAGARAYLLDRRMNPVPIGAAGELFIGGHTVTRGYLNRPALTAERFVPDPFDPQGGGRLYRSGDLARCFPDGTIEFLGRIDQQVKLRGYRIELGEIEATLRRHEAVRDAVVVLREDTSAGAQIVAYIVENQGTGEQAGNPVAELRAFLQGRLPEYMLPSALVLLDALPLTPNGKIDRKALPAPDQARHNTTADYVAPRSAVEAKLAQIWAEVLRQEQVGIHDNFFALGGDSILSIQVVARAHQAGLSLTPKQIFEYRTIAELAPVLGVAPQSQAEQGLVTGAVPLLPIQQWFFAQDLPDPQHYNQAVLLEPRQQLDPELVGQTLMHLLTHHDALRLRFTRDETGWQQFNDGLSETLPFSRIDLAGYAEAERGSAIERIAGELQAGLNLEHGPLLQVALFEAEQSQRLLIAIHHLAVDGVSWRILLEDFQTVYQQLHRQQPAALPAKTSSFKQWAERLAAHADSEEIRQEATYWQSLHKDPAQPLPLDNPDGGNAVAAASTVTTTLSAEETQALLQDVPAAYQTQINDVLLSALAQTIAGWSGGRTLLVNMEGHGRESLFADLDLSRTVGWFTTRFPLRLDLSSASSPAEMLIAVKEQLRQVPNNGLGFGLLRYLSSDPVIAETLRQLPQAEISFNYLGQFDQVLTEAGLFTLAAEGVGPLRSQDGQRSYLLDINCGVVAGQLQVEWTYSEQLHRQETIAWLADEFLAALRRIIAHCQETTLGGFTPSDFPEAELDQDTLDDLISKFGVFTEN